MGACMAFVTRCPYCGSVWLLPDRETAERGPVKCSACQHSFDAASDLLEVPNDLFSTSGVRPATAQPTANHPTSAGGSPNANAQRMQDIASLLKSAPQSTAQPAQAPTDKAQALLNPIATPASTLKKAQTIIPEEEESIEQPQPAKSPKTQSSDLSRIVPGTRPFAAGEPSVTEIPAAIIRRTNRGSTGWGSLLLCFLLILALAAVAAIFFNQTLIERFPQTKAAFTAVCTKVPCPGFYLADARAFVVTSTQLRKNGDSGEYTLTTIIKNTSAIGQAIPDLTLEFLDTNNNTILKRTLKPEEFLDSTQKNVKSLAPQRQLTVILGLSMSMVPSSVIVQPTFGSSNDFANAPTSQAAMQEPSHAAAQQPAGSPAQEPASKPASEPTPSATSSNMAETPAKEPVTDAAGPTPTPGEVQDVTSASDAQAAALSAVAASAQPMPSAKVPPQPAPTQVPPRR